ncbi:AAA family ATPase [Candidatus Lucifugimonas marina]|uniref:ATPase dynein-related AAA domain-containing protein n=1 Tax=Candidatus Lucifugimonas marina TaxID=3038979 RepID=A0AAJ5ZCN3_9CHLR|nr:hypothetical protein [SAR202 cluster bacterium JH639]WFG38799.1 hypothetical protein GKO48_03960 [SAR202 cluster bacterium JH1073]
MPNQNKLVERVWFWRYNISAFRAVYGRLDGTLYSKDFLQSSGKCAEALTEQFGEDAQVTLAWPGGSVNGRSKPGGDNNPPSALRQWLGWWSEDIPAPWAMYKPDDSSLLKTFEGDPGHTDEQSADGEWKDYDPSSGTTVGWLVAVKLEGVENQLQVRAYLENPPSHLIHTDFKQIPQSLRAPAEQLASTVGCCVVSPTNHGDEVRAEKIIHEIDSALETESCVLLTGPPGTGKTVALEDLRNLWEYGARAVSFNPSKIHDAWSSIDRASEGKVRHVVFHPSYSYDEFVIGLYPKSGQQGAIELEARPGPLMSLGHWAMKEGNNALLIVDEFNRGNAAGIFGDTLALLDKAQRFDHGDERSGTWIDRAHPDMKVNVRQEFANDDGTEIPEQLRLPKSLKIVAALNSSDRSVAPLDAAVRRRFAMLPVLPDYELLANHLNEPYQGNAPEPFSDPTNWVMPETVMSLAVSLLKSLNERIEALLGQDFLLGHSLFWDVLGTTAEEAVLSLGKAFDTKVRGTLQMTFADQDELLGAVLNAGAPGDENSTGPSLTEWVTPSESISAFAPPRLRLKLAEPMEWSKAAQALNALL